MTIKLYWRNIESGWIIIFNLDFSWIHAHGNWDHSSKVYLHHRPLDCCHERPSLPTDQKNNFASPHSENHTGDKFYYQIFVTRKFSYDYGFSPLPSEPKPVPSPVIRTNSGLELIWERLIHQTLRLLSVRSSEWVQSKQLRWQSWSWSTSRCRLRVLITGIFRFLICVTSISESIMWYYRA